MREEVNLTQGAEVYFRLPGMPRKRRGVVVGGSACDYWEIQGCRQANSFKPQRFIVPAGCIQTPEQHKAERQPTGRFEAVSTRGHSLVATEINRRAELARCRFRIPEAEVIGNRQVSRRMVATLTRLASTNGLGTKYFISLDGRIDNTDHEARELLDEYLLGFLQAFRCEVSKAPHPDLDEFADYLAGTISHSRISGVCHRTGETVAIRFLKKRAGFLRELSDDDLPDVAAPTREEVAQWTQVKGEIARALRQLRIVDRTATKVVLWKFALGRDATPCTNKGIAERLRHTTGEQWTAGKVARSLVGSITIMRRHLTCKAVNFANSLDY